MDEETDSSLAVKARLSRSKNSSSEDEEELRRLVGADLVAVGALAPRPRGALEPEDALAPDDALALDDALAVPVLLVGGTGGRPFTAVMHEHGSETNKNKPRMSSTYPAHTITFV